MSQTRTMLAQYDVATGYVSELRCPGIYELDGNSGGYRGRAQRYRYLQ